MKRNEKGIAGNNALETNLNQRLTMIQYTAKQNNFQFNINGFVCDECCLPMRLYGANFIENYSNGYANTLRCLCDLHADEMGVQL